MPHEQSRSGRVTEEMTNQALRAFQTAEMETNRLRKSHFTLTNGVSGERAEIARYEAPYPFAIREGAFRLVITAHETFTTDGSGTVETHALANDLIQSGNTEDFVLFSDGARVQADSVDYAADTFDYTDGGVAEDLDVYYVATDHVEIEIWKEAPGTVNNLGVELYDDTTLDLHSRNHNQTPPEFSFTDPYDAIVPSDWDVVIYADTSNYAVTWNEATNSTEAENAIVDIPIFRVKENIPGLGSEVTSAIGNRF